jgi:aryl-alcohol dehydrogenase-like predicted oxidoreductase
MSMTPIYGKPDPESAIAALHRAAEVGIDLIDTSDAYGKGANEELVGRALAGRRGRYRLATKFGNLRLADGTPAVNGRPEYVAEACEASLRRLGTDYIDLYYQHRIDASVPIEDTVGAMARLVEQGKVRHLGLSEAAPATLRRANAVHQISALQSEYSLWTRDVEAEILGVCEELGIGFVCYSPLGRGFLTGTISSAEDLPDDDIRRTMPRFQKENFEHNAALVAELRHLADEAGCTPAQLAIAWLLSRPPKVVVLAGASRVRWVEENAAAADLSIRPHTIDSLSSIFAPGAATGERLPEALLKRVGL